MKRFFSLILLCILLCALLPVVSAQETIEESLPTENVDSNRDSNIRENRSNHRIREIYKKRSGKIGYGNPCIEKATQKMGFVYAIIIKGQPEFRWELTRNWHNLWVKLGLVFRRGPWWGITIRKRIKDCRRKSGDLVGA